MPERRFWNWLKYLDNQDNFYPLVFTAIIAELQPKILHVPLSILFVLLPICCLARF